MVLICRLFCFLFGAVLPFFSLNIHKEVFNYQEIPVKPFHQLSPLEAFWIISIARTAALFSVLWLQIRLAKVAHFISLREYMGH